MGNRGSKSGLMPVKEQLVEGSWFLAKLAISLRCILMDCENSYQVRFLSKQLNKKIFSTLLAQQPKLNPWFVTGFADGE